MKTIFICNECGYKWEDSPDSFCPCCDNPNIYEFSHMIDYDPS